MSTQWEPDESEWQLWGDRGHRSGCLPLVVLMVLVSAPWLLMLGVALAVTR